MHFTKIFASAAALCASVSTAAMTSATVVANIEFLASNSTSLANVARTISIVNVPLGPAGPYGKVITGFRDFISFVTTDINAMSDNPTKFTAQSDLDAIFTAYSEFVKEHQALLTILIGKEGVIGQLPFLLPPVAATLRQDEKSLDAFTFYLTNSAEAIADKLKAQGSALDITLDAAIKKYEP